MRALLLSLLVSTLVACGDDVAVQEDARRVDAAEIDAGSDDGGGGPDASCFTNPQTHLEIINACTTAEKVYKNPTLPLLQPDGGLPPLP